ncbi:MAG TPA: type 1 glutamine amidotransferase [Ideonella sp.]|uniref:type 1 glutamine amidotransferase n=1 Tax=Ideonella sp. TaxID=1929293 RepID=UPI002C7C2D8D|nr:type 1 glutamine amidotransferase [Ideonella sp.]HSI47755.1 type 1 glutamine amidotransferase [Ideonella sp.]
MSSPSRPRLLIVQPMADDGPAYLAHWLQQSGLPFDLASVAAGDEVPASAEPYDAIAMLGGAMSVNDELPFLHRAEALLRDAVARGRPVLGHCLGGQMLAKALGAPTTDNPVPEFGWTHITPTGTPLAQNWFGRGTPLPVYQWHFQTFALPEGATLLAGNAACPHQAFGFGPHLGMQFHIEVDDEKLNRWCSEAPQDGDPLRQHATVQGEAAMRADTTRFLADSQRMAAHIYARWLALAGFET